MRDKSHKKVCQTLLHVNKLPWDIESSLKNNFLSDTKTDPLMSHREAKGLSKKMTPASAEWSFCEKIKIVP